MNYVAIGCITIDNILNAYGEKRLRQFGGNAAYGAMGMRLWQPGQIGMVAGPGRITPRHGCGSLQRSVLIRRECGMSQSGTACFPE